MQTRVWYLFLFSLLAFFTLLSLPFTGQHSIETVILPSMQQQIVHDLPRQDVILIPLAAHGISASFPRITFSLSSPEQFDAYFLRGLPDEPAVYSYDSYVHYNPISDCSSYRRAQKYPSRHAYFVEGTCLAYDPANDQPVLVLVPVHPRVHYSRDVPFTFTLTAMPDPSVTFAPASHCPPVNDCPESWDYQGVEKLGIHKGLYRYKCTGYNHFIGYIWCQEPPN